MARPPLTFATVAVLGLGLSAATLICSTDARARPRITAAKPAPETPAKKASKTPPKKTPKTPAKKAAKTLAKKAAVTTRAGHKKPGGLMNAKALKALKAPAMLSKANKKAILKASKLSGQPGTVYAKVDPSAPVSHNQLGLIMVGPSVVNPMHATASFPRMGLGSTAYAGLWLKSAKGGARYLVDCAVTTYPSDNGKPRMTVKTADNSISHHSFEGPGHLTWILDSPDALWHDFKFGSKNASWTLHGCEITNL